MDNKKGKYKGFDTALAYMQDVLKRYIEFKDEFSEISDQIEHLIAYSRLDAKYLNPQDVEIVQDLIKAFKEDKHLHDPAYQIFGTAFEDVNDVIEYYTLKEAFRKERIEARHLYNKEQIELYEDIIEEIFRMKGNAMKQLQESGPNPEIVADIAKYNDGIEKIRDIIKVATLPLSAFDDVTQN